MTINVGSTDRAIRLAVAVLLVLAILFVTEGALSWVLGVVAAVLAVTALTRRCPAYAPFGISTAQ